MSEELVVRRDGTLWTCTVDEQHLEAVGFIDLIIGMRKELQIQKFSITFDCEGSGIDGAVATFDFGTPDTYVDG